MKQIFSYLIPYRARMAVGFSIKVAATIVELLIPWALSIMVDNVIPTENIGFVFAWGGVMILFALLAVLGNIVANRMASLVARNTTERIRLQLFSKISFLSARQQEQIGQASLISRSTSDNERIKYEITGQAVLQILRMKINFSLQTLIKQLLVMKSAEEDAFRRDLIDSIIRDFSNSDSGGPNRRTATADNKSMFNGKKINRIH